MKIRAVDIMPQTFILTWENGKSSELPFIWLRDNDPDELHPDTRERTFDLTGVELNIRPLSHRLEDNSLIVDWPGRSAPSRYNNNWLVQTVPGMPRPDPAEVGPDTWNSAELVNIPYFEAEQCCSSNATFYSALAQIKRQGIAIFRGLDDASDAGEIFAEQIGFKRQTNFGVIFEVINKPSPNNLAYTSLALPLHTDLSNQESIPGYQFLHCWKNNVSGGESKFADGYRVCKDLLRERPDYFKLLSETEIPWRFHDEDVDIRFRRPVIDLDNHGGFRGLAFNAHLADIPDLPSEQLYAFYEAYRDLMQRIRDPDYLVRYPMGPGEMVMFDNRRILHGREAFDPCVGERHFRGFYIEHNEVNSRMRVLARLSYSEKK